MLVQNVAYLKRKLRRTEIGKASEKAQRVALAADVSRLQKQVNDLQAERHVIRLKDPETGYFTEAAKLCIMEIVGEQDVAAKRCGPIIEVICRTLMHGTVPESDLPSERSVVRFLDIGHALCKYHITDAMLSSENFDLHLDGTTKSGKKYVGHQVTTDSGETRSCGFQAISTENTTNLVSQAVSILEELSLVYDEDPDKRQEVFVTLLQNLSALMSDRAAVMKSFDAGMNSARKDLLNTDENLLFLHCNAHYLLGLVTATDKVFKGGCGEDRAPMGRETIAKFQRSSRGEHPVTRFIREACACLGPRGDDKFGCRLVGFNKLRYHLMLPSFFLFFFQFTQITVAQHKIRN